MDYTSINRQAWNQRTLLHVASRFYDVDSFLMGKSSLNEIERSELGSVRNKKLLHLQCHFGLDTLSWAREGAIVTGVDLSDVAIAKACELSRQTGLCAEFICCDLYDFTEGTSPDFDIVFTSYGAICWLPCINRWAQTICNSLKKGGTFYMVEFHPIYDVIAGYSYFHCQQPDVEQEETYTENSNGQKNTVATWGHALSDVINALINVGIRIEQLNEFPFSPYPCFEGLEQREKGKFYLAQNGHDVPLVYSIKGKKVV